MGPAKRRREALILLGASILFGVTGWMVFIAPAVTTGWMRLAGLELAAMPFS
jgi:hypothetical protein